MTTKARLMAIAFGAVFLVVWFAYVIGRWSTEDNMTECYYEAQKLVAHIRNDPTNEIGSSLVSACMKARRFDFDYKTLINDEKDFRAMIKTYNFSDEKIANEVASYKNGLYSTSSYWHRDWARYLPL